MIFAKANHIEQVKKGFKTQTRRQSDRYQVGHFYSIQPKRTAKGIPDGKICIIQKRLEIRPIDVISLEDALAEGGYTPEEFERLYEAMYPQWKRRYAYSFTYVSQEEMSKQE